MIRHQEMYGSTSILLVKSVNYYISLRVLKYRKKQYFYIKGLKNYYSGTLHSGKHLQSHI